MMKIRAAIFVFLLAESVSAFTVAPRAALHHRSRKPLFEAATTTTTDLETATPDGAEIDLEKALGIKDGDLALGVNAEEVLKYIGRCVTSSPSIRNEPATELRLG